IREASADRAGYIEIHEPVALDCAEALGRQLVMVAFIGDEYLSGTDFADADLRGATYDRQAQVRAFLAAATTQLLVEECPNPNDPSGGGETVRRCVQVILEEEWEHLRFATRDLDALDDGRA